MRHSFFLFLLVLIFSVPVFAQDTAYTKQEVIYGRKDGMALTMVVIKPQRSNGKGIINLISGNWVSGIGRDDQMLNRARPYIKNGYTVFLTMHSSAPRYSIPDAVADVKRAVQYVRYNALVYGIDSTHIGITGFSSGGHLAMMAATSDDIRNPNARDPVQRVSSKVQAVAVFYPPTDFLHYGQANFNPLSQKAMLQQLGVLGAFEFKEWDSAKRIYKIIEDNDKILAIAKAISPAEQVTPDDAPTYIIHGDKDMTVPLQQSQLIQEKLQAAKVPVVVTIKPGAGHGWRDMDGDEKELISWFDRYLK